MSKLPHPGLPRHTRLLLAGVCLLVGACASRRNPVTPPPPHPVEVSDAERIHALAFGAILDSQNGDPHSRLVPPMQSDEREKDEEHVRELIASSWDIHSREELLDTLAKIQNGENGQRRAYWDIRRRLLEAKMENYLRVISEAAAQNNGGARAFVAATHLSAIHGSALPITAWDFGRYINLCRWGVDCGWLTEQEAWDRIIPAARLLQASYASWDDYAADYLLGRNFWNPGTASDNETIRYRVTLLKLPPKGLWSTIDWNDSLGAGEVLRDTLAAKLLDHYEDPDPNGVSLDHVPNQNPVLIMLRTSIDPK